MTETSVSPEYLPLADAAAYAGFSVRTTRRYIAEGRLPAYRIGPRQIRVKRSDLDALMTPIPTTGEGA